MHQIQATYKKSIKGITLVLLFLFGFHFIGVHGLNESLVYCFEENGQVNIESKSGSIFTIPSEDMIHAKNQHHHKIPSFDSKENSHHDVPLSLICSEEQQTTRFDQERALTFLSAILSNKIENLPQSRVFDLVSYTSPLIKNTITASLNTVVRILYN